METTATITPEFSQTKKLVILLSRGIDDERSTVAWTLANAGINSGQEVTMFLVSAGADVARRGAADLVRMNPVDPSLKELIDSFLEAGGTVWVCPPCASLRGYEQENLMDGATITGAGPFHDLIMDGAATLCL